MRAFGPGSVSSFLKAVLDVVTYALVVVGAAVALAAVGVLLSQPFIGPARPSDEAGPLRDALRLLHKGPLFAGLLALSDVYIAALVLTADRLRRLFATLIEGRPFQPDNIERLRIIGLALIVLELAGYAVRMLGAALLPGAGARAAHGRGFDLNLTAWFAILVVFVLAEVFREGARLQSDAEFTV